MASDDDQPVPKDVLELRYETSLMYGSYSRSLGEYSKAQAARLREMEANEDGMATKEVTPSANAMRKRDRIQKWIPKFNSLPRFILNQTLAKVGEDWVFLALLGVIMALISFAVDFGIYMCVYARLWLFYEAVYHPALQFLAWVILPVFLVLFASGFVFLVAPQAVGSGIPEMKTILRGVVLKEYLTFPTLIAKSVGLTATLGSGMPLGKEGPLVHIGSIVGTLLSKHLTSFKGIYENQARKNDMLAAACAVGVSSSLGAPIGGVLFSIEVTSSHFAVRNYWRGFFAASCSALMYRLLSYWFNTEDTLTAVFPTNFKIDFPYDPFELFIFAVIGFFGGLSGALFVLMHRRFSLFVRTNPRVSTFLKKNRLIYPGVISFIVATVFFPLGSGRYLATTQSNKQHLSVLFGNFTWMGDDLTPEQADHLATHWDAKNTNLFFSLTAFMLSVFFMNLLANTLPVPHGSFVPIFKMGAAFGRMIGEAMYLWFPEGIRTGSMIYPVLPGGYAMVGAAAVSAGVTHTVSLCVVVSEMTGQIHHIIPLLVAVLISNAVSSLLQPSLYESIIIIKKLPYLPTIRPSTSGVHSIYAEDFMNRDIKYVWKGITFEKLKNIVEENKEIRCFPLLSNQDQMALLGSIQRLELSALIDHHISCKRRLEVAAQRRLEAKSRERKRKMGMLLSHFAQPPPKKSTDDCDTSITFDFNSTIGSVESIRCDVSSSLPSNTDDDGSLQSSETSIPKTKNEVKRRRPSESILKIAKSLGVIETKQLKRCSSLKVSTAAKRVSIAGDYKENRQFSKTEKKFRRKSSGLRDLRKFSLIDKVASIPIVYPPYFKKSYWNVTSKNETSSSIDMSEEEKQEWERDELKKVVDFQACPVDPAPFQLVGRTSLLKVHNIFSFLGVQRAYVTAFGKLIGIVSLKEMRKAVEDVNSGKLVPKIQVDVPVMRNSDSNDMDPEAQIGSFDVPPMPEESMDASSKDL